ncbi:MAG: long-chain acyl-CoA synthetase [Halieaceae bacterium]|jgi:acyl-CoA synthetase (AMP-forming)/AMP-acid ligase II
MSALKEHYQSAISELTKPGAPFETVRHDLGGIEYSVYLNAPKTFIELLDKGRTYGDQEFLVFQNERLSFNEFYRQVDLLALQLRAEFGVGAGDRVAIAMRNYPEWMVAFVAVVKVGAVIVPLNSWGLAQELQQCLSDAQVSLIFCDEKRLQILDPNEPEIPTIVVRASAFINDGNRHRFEDVINVDNPASIPDLSTAMTVDPEELAMIMYTSGTSGKPKGAMFSHRNCCQSLTNFEAVGAAAYICNIDSYNRHGQKGMPPRALLAVPLFHVSGLFSQFILNLRGGRCLVMMYKWDPVAACRLIDQEKISLVMGAPSMLLDLLSNSEFQTIDSSNIINMSAGGAATPSKLAERVSEKVPSALPGAGWGMTESGAAGTAFTGYFVNHKPGSSGFVNPIVALQFCDESGKEVPSGTPGEVWLKSPTVIMGYLNATDANCREFQDGWFRTGDIGYLDEDGCIFICDRAKDMVIRGGENIYPIEIEHRIQAMPGVEAVAAFAVHSEQYGEEVAAVVKVATGNVKKINANDIKRHCEATLAYFKVPSFIVITEVALPVNAVNKVIKSAVREKFFPELSAIYS